MPSRIYSAMLHEVGGAAVRQEGSLAVGDETIVFTDAYGVRREFSIDELRVRFGGVDSAVCFLSHPKDPTVEISCAEPSIAADTALLRLPAFAFAVRDTRQAGRRFWILVTVLVVTLILLLITALLSAFGALRLVAQGVLRAFGGA